MGHGAQKFVANSLLLLTRKEHHMPILLWLVGIPIPLIILIMLLR
jgi:hypothetical protein